MQSVLLLVGVLSLITPFRQVLRLCRRCIERPSIPLSKFAINVDLENQKATIEGNANVNVNVTTTEKVITKYKYKTIKELVYRPVYIQKFNAPVKPEIDSCMLPRHIAPLTYVVSK